MENALKLIGLMAVAVVLVFAVLGWWFDHYMDKDVEQ